MPISLHEYADWLDNRTDLFWPKPPQVHAPKVKPLLRRLRGIRLVTFNTYGTLIAIRGGELRLVEPNRLIMETALEKTIQEFKMWPSMTRKPGKPSEYMMQQYQQLLDEAKLRPAVGERYPEIRVEEIWEKIINRLMKKEYTFDVNFYGSLTQFARCVAFFFHASLQGYGPQPGALATLRALKRLGFRLGIIGDGQAFTRVQLLRALRQEGELTSLNELFDEAFIAISAEVGARRPSETLFRKVVSAAAERGIPATSILHVGNSLELDVAPAKRLHLRTALYAGDKEAVQANKEQLADKATRPDVLLAELRQLVPCLRENAPAATT